MRGVSMHETKHKEYCEGKRAQNLVFSAFRRFYTKCTIKNVILGLFWQTFFSSYSIWSDLVDCDIIRRIRTNGSLPNGDVYPKPAVASKKSDLVFLIVAQIFSDYPYFLLAILGHQ